MSELREAIEKALGYTPGARLPADLEKCVGQHDALRGVAELVVRYDDAVLAWDSMKSHDPETAKARRDASDEASRLCDEMIAAARATSNQESRSE